MKEKNSTPPPIFASGITKLNRLTATIEEVV
jgi:hypothetical protein